VTDAALRGALALFCGLRAFQGTPLEPGFVELRILRVSGPCMGSAQGSRITLYAPEGRSDASLLATLLHEAVHVSGINDHGPAFKARLVEAAHEAYPESAVIARLNRKYLHGMAQVEVDSRVTAGIARVLWRRGDLALRDLVYEETLSALSRVTRGIRRLTIWRYGRAV